MKDRIIADNGQSSAADRAWLESLVADFIRQFPPERRRTSSEKLEKIADFKDREKRIPEVCDNFANLCGIITNVELRAT